MDANLPEIAQQLDQRSIKKAAKEQLSKRLSAQRRQFAEYKDSKVPVVQAVRAAVDVGRPVTFSLKNFQLELFEGEIVLVGGRNGSGKTTLLELVSGMRKCVSGVIRYPALSKTNNWREIKARIRFLQQNSRDWGPGTLKEAIHLRVLATDIPAEDVDDHCEWLINAYELEDHSYKKFVELSEGYKLRATLALSMASDAQLIVLDEPMAPLDASAQVSFLSFLMNFVGSKANPPAVIVSSQHIYELELIADKILFLSNGRVEMVDGEQAFPSGSVFETLSAPDDIVRYKEHLDEELDIKTVENGVYLTHQLPGKEQLSSFLERLTAKGIRVRHIRDLTGSVRLLLDQSEESE